MIKIIELFIKYKEEAQMRSLTMIILRFTTTVSAWFIGWIRSQNDLILHRIGARHCRAGQAQQYH